MKTMQRVVITLAMLAAAPAFAQVYVTGQLGRVEHEVSVSSVSIKDSDTAASVALGYKMAPNFAVEGGYAYLGEFSKSEAGYTLYAKPTTFYGAVVGSVNIAPAMALHAKLGVARTSTTVGYRYLKEADSQDVNQTHGMFAVGASYAFTPNLAVVAEYTYFGKIAEDKPTNESIKASVLSAGVRFTF